MKQYDELPAVLAFRALPKWKQLAVGLPLLWACAASLVADHNEPGVQKGIFLQIALLIASIVLTELLRPKPKLENARPAGLGDFQFPTATEGRAIPLVWGRVRTSAPNVVWYGALEQEAITEKIKTGLWDSSRITTGFRYHLGVQAAICRGPIEAIHAIYIGEDEVWSGTSTTTVNIDKPELFGGSKLGQGGFQGTFQIYTGTTSQSVDTYLSRYQDAGAGTIRTPRYSGTCHLVFYELNGDPATCRGGYVGNSTSIKPWKIEVSRYPTWYVGQNPGDQKIGVDCNPMNVLYEILTNTEWGLGFSAADIDTGTPSTWATASATCITEGLGFSMVLDNPLEIVELIRELERHINGAIYLDQRTGKWRVQLARGGYTVGTLPQLTESNVVEVRDFVRGTWQETVNSVRLKFQNRGDNYKDSHAYAQDMANYITQGGGTIGTGASSVSEVTYPGVKSASTANQIAWRELRLLSRPLVKASFTLTREFWDLRPADVIAWTDSRYGISQLPMRIVRISGGTATDGKIQISCVQDVFDYADATFSAPPSSSWVAPAATLSAYPADEQVVIEAPRAIVVRDPDYEGTTAVSKILTAARRQGLEAAYTIKQRNASGTPTGSYNDAGVIVGFMKIGELTSNVSQGVAVPAASISVTPSPDGQTSIEALFDDTVTLVDNGVNLLHLVMVNNEFMLVSSASTSGANVLLQNVYRGVLDSVQGAHTAGDPVYILFAGAGLSETSFNETYNVDVRLVSRTANGSEFSGTPTTVSLTMNRRARRPYPPAALLFNGDVSPWTTPNAEDTGASPSTYSFDVDIWRRDYRIADEATAVTADDTLVDPTTEYQLKVYADPSGSNTLVHTSAWQTDGPFPVTRNELLSGGGMDDTFRFIVQARHDIDELTNLTSLYSTTVDKVPTSALSGQFYLGSMTTTTASSAYTALATGTYTVTIDSAFSTAAVQYRLNGGAWTTAITAGGTTGNITGVTATDTIEIRRSTSESATRFVTMSNPSATQVAYGLFPA